MSPELTAWLLEQPLWLKTAAHRLLCNTQLSEADITELAGMIKDPLAALDAPAEAGAPVREVAAAVDIRLVSIGPIAGIDALNPRAPLSFGSENLVVVYGHNGSGKSGYTRIICKACGKPHAGNLKSNVFAPPPAQQGCKIKYSVAGVETEIEWTTATAPIAALAPVDVFDSNSGRTYLENESEVAFIPQDLALLADLVTACGRVEANLAAEERALVSALPRLPPEHDNTPAEVAYRGINHAMTEAQIEALTEWNEAQATELDAINASLAIADPLVAAQRRRAIKRQRETLANDIDDAIAQLIGAHMEKSRAKFADVASKRKVATEAAEALQATSAVDGVGTDTWRAMWQAARAFALEEAFPFSPFPPVGPDERCVLCHQELDAAARERLSAFETYIRGEVQTAAASAERGLAEHLQKIALRPSQEALLTAVGAAELSEPVHARLEEVWAELDVHLRPLREGNLPEAAIVLGEHCGQLAASLRDLAAHAETEAEALMRSANPEVRSAAATRKKELEAKKWVSEQGAAVRAEVTTLKQVHSYQQWKRQTNTTGISRKGGELSETLVTEAYVRRFNAELANLGANGLNVELVKTRTERGRSKHSIRLRNAIAAGTRMVDILSEGERRILSLAAFLADVTGRNARAPFIFDDPISSLDQTWEERVIDRMVALSQSRQVIVFTHRLSLLGIITEKAEAGTLNSIHIRRETWGTGQPGDVPLSGKNPRAALNQLKGERLARARRTLTEQGQDAFYPLAKAICSDVRIVTERLVETVLLSDVIQRHRRAIKTMNQIENLAKITPADCSLIDTFMTKYSRYEHSQSTEAPVELPHPDELNADIEQLLAWHDEFRARPTRN